jgi:positive regulator of sigma E activity
VNETEAVVARVEGDYLWLRPANGHCQNCSDAGTCGLGKRDVPLQRLPNTVGARVGDVVVLMVASGAVLRSALIVYILPLLCGMLAAAAGLQVGGEGAALAGLLGGLAAGWLLVARIDRQRSCREPVLSIRIKPLVPTLQRK